ncbi:mevalonate kinase [Lapidilactobacillus achengensis]|uniref:Mevalonate kinase n=1 Tax=Lapidilactobacillus achengensis TaxID=2486000 RepID=A0ABW1UPM0_9LACO|nr:mevalonate kinase [Lapidilactobacillus achengensis]
MSTTSPESTTPQQWPLVQTSVGASHAKLILAGEHAVVYDIPGIAIPLRAIKVTAQISSQGQQAGRAPSVTLLSDLYQGDLALAPAELANLQGLFAAFFAYFPAAQPLPAAMQVTLTSAIPFERGMGSSAAIASAIVAALAVQFPSTLSLARQKALIATEEKIQHGNPSGLDALVVGSAQGYYFRRGHMPEALNLRLPGALLIVDSGLTGQTGTAIAQVAALRQAQPQQWQALMQAIGQITPQIRLLLQQQPTQPEARQASQRRLGELLDANQQALQQLQVSLPQLDQLIQRLRVAGAWGAKLTGGGLGGCVFGYFPTALAAKQARPAFADYQTWVTDLS